MSGIGGDRPLGWVAWERRKSTRMAYGGVGLTDHTLAWGR
jgi:hypothetical protein